MQASLSTLRQANLVPKHTEHSRQFAALTRQLFHTLSAASVIPALTPQEIELYAELSLLHDIGKQAIPADILNKPGPLTKEEFALMKAHTTVGCELLKCIPDFSDTDTFLLACDVCRHHHERWDGSGYPDRLAGNRITPWVHVVGLADAFDALIHPRVYKPAFPPAQARDMIVSGACGRFEPDIAECFAESLPNFFVSVYQQPFAS